MPIQVNCPSCGQSLRVPDELLGRNVRCPQCQTTFEAAGAAETAAEESPSFEQWQTSETPPPSSHERARQAIMIPAILLLVVGILGVLLSGYYLFTGLFLGQNPDLVRQQMKVSLEMQGKKVEELRPEERQMVEAISGWIGPGYTIAGLVGIPLSLLVVFGSIQMLRLRMRGLAVTASVVAMLPYSCCCVLGLPIGIWSLMVLARPEVKAAFS